MVDLFAPLFGQAAITSALDAGAWVRALCDTEAALGVACLEAGLITAGEAEAIAKACAEVIDPAGLAAEAVAGGNPVIPLVKRLREKAPKVHLGATSQDILDTASMLVAKDALGILLTELRAAASETAALARKHRSTRMAGRTLLQQAAPTTFGALAAVWGGSLDYWIHRLEVVRSGLPVQLGGAAGTLAEFHPHGFAVRAALARQLGLAEPAGVWHADRTPVIDLATALGGTASVVGKIATDVVLLAQTEIGELQERSPGGSSAMPHKQNPIAAITARAAAAQAPGLVATVLAASPELQRGAGPWHAEWPAMSGLLAAVGGSASRLRTSLSGLRVDAARMASNLSLLAAATGETGTGHAVDLVDRYLEGRRT